MARLTQRIPVVYDFQMRNDGCYPSRLSQKILLHLQILAYTFWLRCFNFLSRRSIVGDSDVDVSLTTHGQRVQECWRTIETIGRGSLRPRRVILWVCDRSLALNPPPALRRLAKRGLAIKLTVDFGPHTKYFPYVMNEGLDCPLVTADDDVLYPKGWLAGLVREYSPDEVVAYRVRMTGGGAYVDWPLCTSSEASRDGMATGVSGVIYPPKLLMQLRKRGDGFIGVCPKADDFWLHYAAVASGMSTRQMTASPATWWPTRPWNRGLWVHNLFEGGNDAIAEGAAAAWADAET